MADHKWKWLQPDPVRQTLEYMLCASANYSYMWQTVLLNSVLLVHSHLIYLCSFYNCFHGTKAKVSCDRTHERKSWLLIWLLYIKCLTLLPTTEPATSHLIFLKVLSQETHQFIHSLLCFWIYLILADHHLDSFFRLKECHIIYYSGGRVYKPAISTDTSMYFPGSLAAKFEVKT